MENLKKQIAAGALAVMLGATPIAGNGETTKEDTGKENVSISDNIEGFSFDLDSIVDAASQKYTMSYEEFQKICAATYNEFLRCGINYGGSEEALSKLKFHCVELCFALNAPLIPESEMPKFKELFLRAGYDLTKENAGKDLVQQIAVTILNELNDGFQRDLQSVYVPDRLKKQRQEKKLEDLFDFSVLCSNPKDKENATAIREMLYNFARAVEKAKDEKTSKKKVSQKTEDEIIETFRIVFAACTTLLSNEGMINVSQMTGVVGSILGHDIFTNSLKNVTEDCMLTLFSSKELEKYFDSKLIPSHILKSKDEVDVSNVDYDNCTEIGTLTWWYGKFMNIIDQYMRSSLNNAIRILNTLFGDKCGYIPQEYAKIALEEARRLLYTAFGGKPSLEDVFESRYARASIEEPVKVKKLV